MMAIHMQKSNRGFTLVELAVVVTIVGLLIGGVFKGLELLDNSRMTGTLMQVRSIEAAVGAFKTAYKDLPGDIQSPGGRLLDCNGVCASGGNGDGTIPQIPTSSGASSAEGNTLWYHLKAANLLAVPAPDAAGFIYFEPQMSGMSFFNIAYFDYTTYSYYEIAGPAARHWIYMLAKPVSSQGYSIPLTKLALLDLKGDDGKPWSGNMMVNGVSCNIPTVAGANYSPGNKTLCAYMFGTNF